MISLRNRGRYSNPAAIQEEFQHFADRLGGLLGQIFNQDGEFVQETTQVPIWKTYHNDVAINNGNSSGTSTLPFAINREYAMVVPGGATEHVRVELTTTTTISASRSGTTGDLSVPYAVFYRSDIL